MAKYIKLSDAVDKFVEANARSFCTDQIVYLLNRVNCIEMNTGEWEHKEVIWGEEAKAVEEWQSARCSNCGRYHTTPYHYYFNDYDFCPHCGAWMKGGNDSRGENDYERAIEQMEHDTLYESTYNPEDGSM